MRYKKLVEKLFSQNSNNNAQVAIALVAGLAAGAVISILFAPEKGANTRQNIAKGSRDLGVRLRDSYTSLKDRISGYQEEENEAVAPEVPHFTHTVAKKRKSDIKDLISEAHNHDSEIAQN